MDEAGVAHASRSENPRASLLRPDGRWDIALDDPHTLSEQRVPESIGSRIGAGADDHNLADAIGDRTSEDIVVTEGAEQQVILEILPPEAPNSVAGDIPVRLPPGVSIEPGADLGGGGARRGALVR